MKKEQGFIKWIILIVIALIILGYFGFDVRSAVEAPTTQNNLGWFKETLIWIWTYILKAPALFIWNNVLLPLIHSLSAVRRG